MPYIISKGCLMLVGDHINAIAKYWCNNNNINKDILSTIKENRLKRDGENYHITIVSSSENINFDDDDLSIISDISDEVFDMGIGKIENQNSQTYYVIVKIPYLSNIMNRLSLKFNVNKDNYNHITLGYTFNDIHDKPKSLDTLIHTDSNQLEKKLKSNPIFMKNKFIIESLIEYSLITSEDCWYDISKNFPTDAQINQMISEQLSNIDDPRKNYITSLYLMAKAMNINKISKEEIFKYITSNIKYSFTDSNDSTLKEKILTILNYPILHNLNWDSPKYYSYAIEKNTIEKNTITYNCISAPRNFSFIKDNLGGSSIPNKDHHWEVFSMLGVDCVITLMETELKDINKHGIYNHFFKINDMTPPTITQMKEILLLIKDHKKTIIHCMGGIGRTGTVLAGYLMWIDNLSRSEAINALQNRKTILAKPQEEFLKEWYCLCLEQSNKIDKVDKIDKSLIKLPKIVFPPLIIMVGYPASGKSTVSKTMETYSDKMIRVSQDEIRQKGKCEEMVGQYTKKQGHTVILDRCNLTKEERREWMGLAHKPKTWCIWFDVDFEECKYRITRRRNHPTVKEGTGTRILESLKGQLEEPDKSEGFEQIIIIRDVDEANELITSWGLEKPKEVVDAFADGEDDQVVKFPRTMHLLNLGAATKDDKVMTPNDQKNFLNVEVEVYEKIDGANLGISIDVNGKIRIQNRSHWIDCNSHIQFKKLNVWVTNHTDELHEILEPSRHILYGEWMVARHSISYSQLPDMFMAFDIYDKVEKKFYSSNKLNDALKTTTIKQVQMIGKVNFKKIDDFKNLMGRQSNYTDAIMEGIYVRVCSDDWVIHRAKIVRQGFIAGNEHWSKGMIEYNQFVLS